MSREDFEMKMSKSKYEANRRYDKKTYDMFGFRIRKEERLGELMSLGAKKNNKSRTNYMIDAIRSQLTRDEITIDMLPENTKLVIPVELKPRDKKICMVYLVTSFYLGKELYSSEKYVTVLESLEMARKYANNKLDKKAYPEDWVFTIYGKNFEVKNKAEARVKLRQMAKDAEERLDEQIWEEVDCIEDEKVDDDDEWAGWTDAKLVNGNRLTSFTDLLWTDDFKPEFVEEIRRKKKKK